MSSYLRPYQSIPSAHAMEATAGVSHTLPTEGACSIDFEGCHHPSDGDWILQLRGKYDRLPTS